MLKIETEMKKTIVDLFILVQEMRSLDPRTIPTQSYLDDMMELFSLFTANTGVDLNVEI